MSFPFKIELPQNFMQGYEMCFIEETTEYKHVLDKIVDNPNYHEAIAENGKLYFDTYCTPLAQAKYVVESLLNN